MTLHQELLKCIRNNEYELFKKIIQENNINPTRYCNKYTIAASEYGSLDILRYLIGNNGDPTVMDCKALRMASMNNHFEVVKYLYQQKYVTDCGYDSAFWAAFENKNLKMAKYILDKRDEKEIAVIFEEALISFDLDFIYFYFDNYEYYQCLDLATIFQSLQNQDDNYIKNKLWGKPEIKKEFKKQNEKMFNVFNKKIMLETLSGF